MGSVCVNGRCGFREKSECRDCPKCGWLMLDGPLPETGSIAPPPKIRNPMQIAAVAGAGFVLFLGAIGMLAGSWASADPVAAAKSHAVAAAPAPVIEQIAAPVATPAPVVAVAAPVPAAKASVAKAVAKKPVAKKAAAKKTVAKKKTPAKKATNVARR